MLRMASTRPMANQMDRRWKTSSAEIAPNCPRCASPNTKFCYYNNYSLSQPRYFCKGCRRYWTRGGSLRNVPVGGGCRKNRRSKSSTRNFSSTDRPSFNSYLSHGGVTAANSTVLPPSSTTTSPTSPTNNTGSSATDVSNIDLGVVFAKFFNQTQVPTTTSYSNLGHNNQQEDSPFSLTADSSSSPSPSSSDLPQFPEQQVQPQQQQQPRQTQQSGIDMLGCDDLGVDQDLNFIGNYEEFGLEDTIAPYPEFTDPNGYRLQQSMWMDDFSQATYLWPGAAPETMSPNISWQTSQIQGFDSVTMTPSADHHPHHHLTFHPNVQLNGEICSSFDLSAYGITSSSSF